MQTANKETLYCTIKALQSAQGTNAKLAILEANKDNTLLRDYLKAVYDSSINYFQTKLPILPKEWQGDEVFCGEDILWVNENLASRKVTGNLAKMALTGHTSALDKEGRELMGYIISRSINAGIADTIILKVWPKLWDSFPYMRCSLFDARSTTRGVYRF